MKRITVAIAMGLFAAPASAAQIYLDCEMPGGKVDQQAPIAALKSPLGF
jgi:hypothetical protein